jgi:hypothetical protein
LTFARHFGNKKIDETGEKVVGSWGTSVFLEVKKAG